MENIFMALQGNQLNEMDLQDTHVLSEIEEEYNNVYDDGLGSITEDFERNEKLFNLDADALEESLKTDINPLENPIIREKQQQPMRPNQGTTAKKIIIKEDNNIYIRRPNKSEKIFVIPVVWQEMGYYAVYASTLDDAINKVIDAGSDLPKGEFLENSFEVDDEGIDEINISQIMDTWTVLD